MFLVFSYSVKYFPWEDRQSLICNGLTRLLWLLYDKSNIHPLETALQILHLDLSWTSKMWFNPSWWCWAAAMSPGFRSPLWSWGKQPTPCRVLSCLSVEHYRLRVWCVLLRTIVFKLMMDLSRLIIVKFDVQTLWIYIKLTFPPQWQKVEHGICFAKLITEFWLWSLETHHFIREVLLFTATVSSMPVCRCARPAGSKADRKQTMTVYVVTRHCRAVPSCQNQLPCSTPLQKSNFQMFTLFNT